MPDWRTVGVLCSTRFGLQSEAAQSVRALVNLGARDLVMTGITDVALARSVALTSACHVTRSADPPIVAWLMVDDDIVFGVEAAAELVDRAVHSGKPTSAVYMTSAGAPACCPRPAGGWYAGLGCLALPIKQLTRLEQAAEQVEWNGQTIRAFCECGPVKGHWLSEDYSLCDRLGGVQLAPVPVSHIQRTQLTPSAQTMAALFASGGE